MAVHDEVESLDTHIAFRISMSKAHVLSLHGLWSEAEGRTRCRIPGSPD